MGNPHQKNLKVILSMEQEELAVWLARLPDHEITYVEWLLDEVETALDDMILNHTGLDEANAVIDEIRAL
jgi:hypothetical protein